MNLLRRISFELWYLRHPPWESGIVPPEVVEFIATHKPGRVLDLGCGSGTSSLALVRSGWSVCGVDFAWGAIRKARRKAHLAGLAADFHVSDVTYLPPSVRFSSYDLVLDIGCYHGLKNHERDMYLKTLGHLLAPGGSWLIYGFFCQGESPFFSMKMNKPNELGTKLNLIWRNDGLEDNDRPSAWFCYQLMPS